MSETRKTTRQLPNDFDAVTYLELNADVLDADMDAAEHYLSFGAEEGRSYRRGNPVPADFDPDVYLQLNPDVQSEACDPEEHYRAYGAAEKRPYRRLADLPADFDAELYLAFNHDLMRDDVDPELHYRMYGFAESRQYKKTEPEAYSNADSSQRRAIISYSSSYRNDPLVVNPKVIAFYLPQYHRVKENDEWWGEGFTEWTNVRKARPNFMGHQQPLVPLDEDYYDLADVTVQVKQAKLARDFGISAFCYYMYWFGGRRVLERPLDQMLATPSVDIPFCVCWANENWTRTWDGRADDILLAQVHSSDNDRRFIIDALKYLRDPRYLRIDGRLVILVYRTDLLADCLETAKVWRDEVSRAGLGELHLCAVQFYGITDPTPWGFDAAVEFPPHGWLVPENLPDEKPELVRGEFTGTVFDYEKSVDYALRKPIPNYPWYRGVFPGWDNTARRQDTPHIFHGSNPSSFERWLTGVLRQTIIMSPPEHQVVFINAWNEWGEGARLEPDQAGGEMNLMAVRSALESVRHESEPLAILSRLRQMGDYPERSRDELLILNILRGNEQSLRVIGDVLRRQSS